MDTQRPEDPADLYDLLETEEDLWWDPDPVRNDIKVQMDGESVDYVWRVLMNVNLPGYVCVPRGSRALCLGFAVDMEIPEIDDWGVVTIRRLRSPNLLIDGHPYVLMTVGREYSFDKTFKIISRFRDAHL